MTIIYCTTEEYGWEMEAPPRPQVPVGVGPWELHSTHVAFAGGSHSQRLYTWTWIGDSKNCLQEKDTYVSKPPEPDENPEYSINACWEREPFDVKDMREKEIVFKVGGVRVVSNTHAEEILKHVQDLLSTLSYEMRRCGNTYDRSNRLTGLNQKTNRIYKILHGHDPEPTNNEFVDYEYGISSEY